jgi:hypothetical protein
MNFDELQKAWNSAGNQPDLDEQKKIAGQFINGLRTQRRHHFAWLVWTFFQLTLMTGFVAWLLIGTNKVNLAQEWGMILLLLLPWAVALVLLKLFLKQCTPVSYAEGTLHHAISAAASANSAAIRRSKVLGVMYVAVVPILGVVMWQLHGADKISGRELVCMATAFGTVLGVAALAVAARYYRHLLPQHRHLKAVLGQFDERRES